MPAEPPRDEEIWALIASNLEPVVPPPGAKDRLLGEVHGVARFLPFADDLAECFDLSRDRVKELLSQIDDPAAWTRGIEPIQGYLHFGPGPRCEGLHGGLVRMNPGALVARHRHVDREVTYVLEGALRDGDGVVFGPGQAIGMPPGSEHSLTVYGDGPALVALLNGELRMLG